MNPFHTLSHPETAFPLPPLPAHLQALAADTGDPREHPTEPNGDFLHALKGQADNGTGGPPVHITRVTPDSVTVSSGPAVNITKPQQIMRKLGNVFNREPDEGVVIATSGLDNKPPDRANGIPMSPIIMQGPPPSPPISEVEVVDESYDNHSPSPDGPNSGALPPLAEGTERIRPSSHLPSASGRPMILTSDFVAEPVELTSSSPTHGQQLGPPYLGPPVARQVSNSSTASRTGSLAVVRSGRSAPQRNPSAPTDHVRQYRGEDGWSQERGQEMPVLADSEGVDGRLPEPEPRKGSGQSLSRQSSLAVPALGITQPPRIQRRSTNPTPPSPVPPRSPLLHSHSTFVPSPIMRSQTMVPGLDGAALDSDIIAQTETIRRERLERRQKRFSHRDGVPEGGEVRDKAETKESKKEREETKVLVGNLIGEDHVNYVLMYNMLTGIRIGVSHSFSLVS